MTRFAGTIAVVTGAGSGIGEAAAKRLASEGARLILVGRTLAKLEKVAKEIKEQYGEQFAEAYSADVTNDREVASLAQYIEEKYGDLHVLINNAGGLKNATIMDLSVDDWDEIQALNLRSVFLCSKILGKKMVAAAEKELPDQRRDRSIVNVASLSGHKAGALFPHYSAAKAGVINFSRALAYELAPYGIRVNSVSPGFVETPLTEKGLQNERFVESIKRKTALRRVGTPEEIAAVIAFTASKEASYMTGSDVLVDGGWLIM